MLSLFKFSEATEYLKYQIKENSKTYRYKTLLAEAAGCQLSYLSQVLSDKVLLSADHGAGLAYFWKLGSLDTEYFIELIALSRAGTPKLKEVIVRKIERIKLEAQKLPSRISQIEQSLTPGASYYSAWYYTAIHILLTIPGFRNENAIAGKLNLPITKVRDALYILEKLKLIHEQKGEWNALNSNVHISRESALHELNHLHWRQQSIRAVEEQRDKLSYSGVHSISRVHIEEVKEIATRFIAEVRRVVQTSKEEELICLNCDLFIL